MKIAILLRGYCYKEHYKSFRYTKGKNINYQTSCKSLFDNVVENNDVDFLFHTWNTHNLDIKKLLDTYKPVDYIIENEFYDNTIKKNIYNSCNHSIKSVLQLFQKYINSNNNDYDLIIMTRFDLTFTNKLSSLNYSKNMVNFISNSEYNEDNFIIITKDIINEYIKTINIYYNFSHHIIIRKLIDYSPCQKKFIFNTKEKYINPFYYI